MRNFMMCPSPNIIRGIKSRIMGMTGHVASMRAKERCKQGLDGET